MKHIGNGTEFVIGEPFFQLFYSIWDVTGSKLGFGVAVNTAFAADIISDEF